VATATINLKKENSNIAPIALSAQVAKFIIALTATNAL
jgi:hypothetical protein